jgi:GTP-binding protein Era
MTSRDLTGNHGGKDRRGPGSRPPVDGASAAGAEHRAGFACFVGRPNAGKSTLLNAMVGEKIAITSDKPQTTRRAVRGIVTRPHAQLVVVDTPGLHRPRTLLGERLGDLVRTVWSDVDVVGFCLPADEQVGPGDRRIAAELAEQASNTPVIGIVTKTDRVSRQRVAEQLLAVSELADFADIIPVSAVAGEQVDLLTDLLVARLPAGARLYPDAEITDEPLETRIAELVREAALDGVREELPHSLAALVTEIVPPESGTDQSSRSVTKVFATIFVERSSQKAIILGHKGTRLADVGRRARLQIEPLLGTRVYLDLHIAIAKDWQRDPKQLRKLGFDS